MYDLVIRGGRLIDPAQGIDRAFDVAFEGKTVAAVAPAIASDQAREVISASGLIVVPGLIDLHTHLRYIVKGGRLWHSPESGSGHA
jgi:dihydroorotase